jgi:acyl carrier protein
MDAPSETVMSDVLEVVARTLNSVSGVEISEVSPEKHIFNDLGIDSLDFLDVVFDLDQEFGVKLPIEDWLAELELNPDASEELFTVANLVGYIERARLQSA